MPAKAPRGSASARVRNRKINSSTFGSDQRSSLLARRQKIDKACDRCKSHRIKCDEQKPCTQCVAIKARCVVSYEPHVSSQSGNGSADATVVQPMSPAYPHSHHDQSVATADTTANPSCIHDATEESLRVTAYQLADNQDESFDLTEHVRTFFASSHQASFHTPSLTDCVFPQLPHSAVPSGQRPSPSDALPRHQRSYYLRLFWDTCHPLLQIMSETEFAELNALPPPSVSDEYSVERALADSMIALGIQHSHLSGLANRVLGLQSTHVGRLTHETSSQETVWPGFEYFHRCRERMRTNTDLTLEAMRCHVLMALYLIKGNAFRDAYNLLGIAVRKAYIAKLHRLPLSHISDAEKTARSQLWWALFCLDVECSMQLDVPTASQRSLVTCPRPNEDVLARFVSGHTGSEKGIHPCAFSARLIHLADIISEISAHVSTADLIEHGHSRNHLERYASDLLSVLEKIEVWHNQLPSELRVSPFTEHSDDANMIDFDQGQARPGWLQRQTVLLELHYHSAYILIQRPFLHLYHTQSDSTNGATGLANPVSRQPDTEIHVSSALSHAITAIDLIFSVCSTTDILYGWSEVLQPLWNATLTIMAYVYANPLSYKLSNALDSLSNAKEIFKSLSTTCSTASLAHEVVQSLVNTLHSMVDGESYAIINQDPSSWDFIAPRMTDQQTSPVDLEIPSQSEEPLDDLSLPSFLPSVS